MNQTITKENAFNATEIPAPYILTLRQKEVVSLYCTGHSVKEIADMLHAAPKTIEYHLAQARLRLKMPAMATLIHWALATKLIEPLFNAEFITKQVQEVKVTRRSPIHFVRSESHKSKIGRPSRGKYLSKMTDIPELSRNGGQGLGESDINRKISN